MRSSRNVLTVFLLSSLFLSALFAVTPGRALAQGALAGATVELWNDSDGDGAFGGALDTLIDSTTTDSLGLYSLAVNGACDGCAIVISGWGPADDNIDHVAGKAVPDASGLPSPSATLWNDVDGDGISGTAGDVSASNVVLDVAGNYEVDQADCTACAVVITGWGPADDNIDSIVGNLTGWGPADDNIDGWGPGGDDIDGWGPGGDDIDGWGPGGDDIDGWGPGGDDIDGWGPGGDDIDGWGPGGDDIDADAASR